MKKRSGGRKIAASDAMNVGCVAISESRITAPFSSRNCAAAKSAPPMIQTIEPRSANTTGVLDGRR
jgi:hypothetical protein